MARYLTEPMAIVLLATGVKAWQASWARQVCRECYIFRCVLIPAYLFAPSKLQPGQHTPQASTLTHVCESPVRRSSLLHGLLFWQHGATVVLACEVINCNIVRYSHAAFFCRWDGRQPTPQQGDFLEGLCTRVSGKACSKVSYKLRCCWENMSTLHHRLIVLHEHTMPPVPVPVISQGRRLLAIACQPARILHVYWLRPNPEGTHTCALHVQGCTSGGAAYFRRLHISSALFGHQRDKRS